MRRGSNAGIVTDEHGQKCQRVAEAMVILCHSLRFGPRRMIRRSVVLFSDTSDKYHKHSCFGNAFRSSYDFDIIVFAVSAYPLFLAGCQHIRCLSCNYNELHDRKLPLHRISRALFAVHLGYVATATRPRLTTKITPRYATLSLTFLVRQTLNYLTLY